MKRFVQFIRCNRRHPYYLEKRPSDNPCGYSLVIYKDGACRWCKDEKPPQKLNDQSSNHAKQQGALQALINSGVSKDDALRLLQYRNDA